VIVACGLLVACAAALLAPSPAAAAAPATTTATTTSPTTGTNASPAASTTVAGASINGTLLSGTKPVPGVKVTVSQNGKSVGTATTGPDGKFRIVVPGAGKYDVALDTSTIPSGFQLANPADAVRRGYQVYGAFPQFVVFAFKGASTGGVAQQSDADQLLNLFISGIRFGLIVGLAAIGLSLVYGTTRLVNFAHGELVTFGALVAFWFSTNTGGPQVGLVLATVLAFIAGGLFGGVLELGLWRPIAPRTSDNARMLVSIGLALFLRYFYQVIFTGNSRTYRQYSAQPPMKIWFIELPARDYISMIVCAVVLLAVGLLLQRSRLGTAVRAVASERDLAAASGIDVRQVILAVWVAAAALSALAGVLLAVSESVQWNMGFRLLLTIFAAVVLGGLGSPFGALVGALIVGVVQEVSTYWFPADYKVVFGLGILIVVLLIRPQGIFGVRERIG
jgi:branched-chain amino acid transport system permease protein